MDSLKPVLNAHCSCLGYVVYAHEHSYTAHRIKMNDIVHIKLLQNLKLWTKLIYGKSNKWLYNKHGMHIQTNDIKKIERLLPFCTLIVLSKENQNENEKEEHWI